MAGLEQNNPIRPSSTVLPHGPGKNRCHDEQRRRPGKIGLIRAIRTCDARTYFGRESCQTVIPGLVVIHSPLEPVHPERHQIYLTRVPGTAGRAGLVRKSSEYIRRRSEEHTSELQSRVDLVCRLLLEKKKKHKSTKCTRRRRCRRKGTAGRRRGPAQGRTQPGGLYSGRISSCHRRIDGLTPDHP